MEQSVFGDPLLLSGYVAKEKTNVATVIRRKALVNPHRRRKMSAKQIRIFGTPRQKAALRRRKSASSKTYSPKRVATRSTPRSSRPRRNVSAIITAGLPALANPAKRGSTMAKTKTKRRRTNYAKASTKSYRRHKRTNTHASHRPRTRVVTKIRYRTRKNGMFGKRRRHARRSNPSGRKSGLVMSILAATGGAVGTRAIPNVLLGAGNSGVMGYGANAITAAALAWIAKKFLGRPAGYAALLGGGVAIALRLAQDYSPVGKSLFALSGDPGMGMLLPYNGAAPPQYTGNGAMVKVPSGWGAPPPPPAVAAAKSSGAMGATYRQSTYR
jgi:hypothetical protein